MEALEPRMEEAGGKLRALLGAGLAGALRQGNTSAQAHCLQAFAAVGDAHSAEQVRTVCCVPFCASAHAHAWATAEQRLHQPKYAGLWELLCHVCCARGERDRLQGKASSERGLLCWGSQILREVMVAPLVERTLAEQRQTDTAAGSSGSSISYAQACTAPFLEALPSSPCRPPKTHIRLPSTLKKIPQV